MGYGGNDRLYGNEGNDTLIGGTGSDMLMGDGGNDTYIFSAEDGTDLITDAMGRDKIVFDTTVSKSNIAIYLDSSNNLIIDYGNAGSQDVISIQNQATNTIENLQLNSGEYMTSPDINALIQNMTAYANNNHIEFTGISSVKNNHDLMVMVANSWHG